MLKVFTALLVCVVMYSQGLLLEENDMLAAAIKPGLGQWAAMTGPYDASINWAEETLSAYEVGAVLAEFGFNLRVFGCGGALDAVVKGFADAHPPGEFVSLFDSYNPYDAGIVGMPVKQARVYLKERVDLLLEGGTTIAEGTPVGAKASVFITFTGGPAVSNQIRHAGGMQSTKILYVAVLGKTDPEQHFILHHPQGLLSRGSLMTCAPKPKDVEQGIEDHDDIRRRFEALVVQPLKQKRIAIAEIGERANETVGDFKRRLEAELTKLLGPATPAREIVVGQPPPESKSTPALVRESDTTLGQPAVMKAERSTTVRCRLDLAATLLYLTIAISSFVSEAWFNSLRGRSSVPSAFGA